MANVTLPPIPLEDIGEVFSWRDWFFQVKNKVVTFTTKTNAASTFTATMTNAPVAGNPVKWITIDDNGTPRRIPTW
jgi:hypothetical protein